MSAPLATLLARLTVGKPRVRRAAARHLSKNPHNDARDALQVALADPDPIVRRFAARAIGKCSENTFFEPLVPLLSDPFAIVRAAAAAALPPLAVSAEALRTALERENDAHVAAVMRGALARCTTRPRARRHTRKLPHARLRDLSFGANWQEDQVAPAQPAAPGSDYPPLWIERAIGDLSRATIGEHLRTLPSSIDLSSPPIEERIRDASAVPLPVLDAAMSAMHPAWGQLLLLHRVRRGLHDVAPLARGSSLVLELLAKNARPPIRADLYPLLSAGGGTLARQDYPAFTLVTRPSITIVPPPIDDKMKQIAAEILRVHEQLSAPEALFMIAPALEAETYARLTPAEQLNLFTTLEKHARAYAVLRATTMPDRAVRIRRKHVRPLLDGPLEPVAHLDRRKEGLASALLDHVHTKWTGNAELDAALKEASIHLLRTIALTYHFQHPVEDAPDGQLANIREAHHLADHLIQRTVHAPLELARELGLGHEQHLPRLSGGRLSKLEVEWSQLLKQVLGRGAIPGEQAEPRAFTCKPLDKMAALKRGALGGDCSSSNVPLRALSPHHVYFGVFEGEEQRRGYMTVFEAWAVRDDGSRVPALCLETVNVPIDDFVSVQQDLLVIFEAIARSRGLLPQLVLVRDAGTFNYENGAMLARCPRARKGEAVRLEPADPILWGLYAETTDESSYYSPFEGGEHVILAPFDATRDRVQAENITEAARIAALEPKSLLATVRRGEERIGFISGPVC